VIRASDPQAEEELIAALWATTTTPGAGVRAPQVVAVNF
jgi:hypothetical protein